MSYSPWTNPYIRASFHRALRAHPGGHESPQRSGLMGYKSPTGPSSVVLGDTLQFAGGLRPIIFYTRPVFPLQVQRQTQDNPLSVTGWTPTWNPLPDRGAYPFYYAGLESVVSEDPHIRQRAAQHLDQRVLQVGDRFRILNANPGQFVLESILHLLSDPDPTVRLKTAQALPKMKGYHIPPGHPDGDQKDASAYQQYMGVIAHALVTHPDGDVRRTFSRWIQDPEKQQALAHYVEVGLGFENHGYEMLPFQAVGALKSQRKNKLALELLQAFEPLFKNPQTFEALTQGLMKVGIPGVQGFFEVAKNWPEKESLRPLVVYGQRHLPPAAHGVKEELAAWLKTQ